MPTKYVERILKARVYDVVEELDETGLRLAGYQFGYTTEKPRALTQRESRGKTRNYYESVGLELNTATAVIGQIVPNSPAETGLSKKSKKSCLE